jgi:pimeloyl-ACP methyl ester carboxylesterase
MSKIEFLDVTEGCMFWRFDGPLKAESESTSRPVLLFIHACVADHTLWDDQVTYCTAKGWGCLRYDLFGFGQSSPNESYPQKVPIPAVKHHEHTARVVKAFQASSNETGRQKSSKVIIIGLSCGSAISVDFVLSYPELVSGLVVCAGGLGGLDPGGTPSEDASFKILDDFKAQKDIENIAKTNVKIWGDGPAAEEGRADARTRERLYKWCKDIAAREIAGKGGGAFPSEGLSDPPASERLSQIKAKTIVALGRHDESSTNATMRYVAEHVHKAEVTEFEAAHMINLECPKEFNEWLGAFLDRFMQ